MARNNRGRQMQQEIRVTSKSPTSKLPESLVFELDYYSEAEDIRYQGTFKIRRPKIRDQQDIDTMKLERMGGFHYNPVMPGRGASLEMASLAEMTSFLDVLIEDAPDWYESAEDLTDPSLVAEIYSKGEKIDPFRFVQRLDQSGDNKTASTTGDTESRVGDKEDRSDQRGGLSGRYSYTEHIGTKPSDILEDMVSEEVPTSGNK